MTIFTRFKTLTRMQKLLFAATLAGLTGCASMMPPTLPPDSPRRGIRPRSYKMKLAVFNFIDQTGSAGKLVETIPDVLSTELFRTKRFELNERAELRAIDPAEMQKIREEYKHRVDGFLVGSITRFSVEDKTMTLDIRAINAFNGVVMYAGHHDVKYQGTLDVKAQRADIGSIADEIYKGFPELGSPGIRVISISGETVTINVGKDDGVIVGMGGLVIARGDTLKDPITHKELADEIYVGEVFVIEVMDNLLAEMENIYQEIMTPRGMRIENVYSQTVYINSAIDLVFSNIYSEKNSE